MIDNDRNRRYSCLSVCLSVGRGVVDCGMQKTAEQIGANGKEPRSAALIIVVLTALKQADESRAPALS